MCRNIQCDVFCVYGIYGVRTKQGHTHPPTTTASWHYSKSILLHPIKNVDRFNVSGFFFAVMVLSGAILHCVLDLWSSSKKQV